MRIVFVFAFCGACSPTVGPPIDYDASNDGSASACDGKTPLCFTSCTDDVASSPAACVNGAYEACSFDCSSCHCGSGCSLPAPSCTTCDGGFAARVCNFDAGTNHPYECPPGSYDGNDPDAGPALCGASDAAAE